MTELVIKPMRYGAPVTQQLVAAALADLGLRYGGGGDGTPVAAAEFDPPSGGFLIAYVDGAPAGCGGWRAHDDSKIAELKRMYVAPPYRGQGVARALLAAIEANAVERGRHRMILETGARQPEAISLYESAGYQRIEDFGYYKDEDEVRSFGRDLP